MSLVAGVRCSFRGKAGSPRAGSPGLRTRPRGEHAARRLSRCSPNPPRGGGDRFFAREPPRDDLRDAVAAHRDAVQHVGGLHRALLVRDHDELGLVRVAPQKLDETADVGVVERGFDLVQEIERARLREEEREQERDRAERLLAAGEHSQARDALPCRPQLDLHPGFAALLLRLDEPEPALAAREERRGDVLEVRGDGRYVSAKRRSTVSASSSRRSASSFRLCSRSSRCTSSSASRSFSASYSSFASGFTWPS